MSASTKELVEAYVDAHGIKKDNLVEDALLHHVQALRTLPTDVIMPPHLVVTRKGGEKIAERLEKPRRPTKAMRDIFEK